MSLMAAMGRPQLATGPQKCYKKRGEKGRTRQSQPRAAAASLSGNGDVKRAIARAAGCARICLRGARRRPDHTEGTSDWPT